MKDLEEWQKYVAVVFDEIKIKEDLVYNKYIIMRLLDSLIWVM